MRRKYHSRRDMLRWIRRAINPAARPHIIARLAIPPRGRPAPGLRERVARLRTYARTQRKSLEGAALALIEGAHFPEVEARIEAATACESSKLKRADARIEAVAREVDSLLRAARRSR